MLSGSPLRRQWAANSIHHSSVLCIVRKQGGRRAPVEVHWKAKSTFLRKKKGCHEGISIFPSSTAAANMCTSFFKGAQDFKAALCWKKQQECSSILGKERKKERKKDRKKANAASGNKGVRLSWREGEAFRPVLGMSGRQSRLTSRYVSLTSWTNREWASFSAVSGTLENKVRPWRFRVEIWRSKRKRTC